MKLITPPDHVVHFAGQPGGRAPVSGATPVWRGLLERKEPHTPPSEVPEAGRSMTEPTPVTTVLLVEDEESVRAVTRRILERDGYRVLEARDGREGVAVATTSPQRIDLLITDVLLPDIGGGEVAREVARVQPQSRVLFLSGYSGESLSDYGIPPVSGNFLQKPFTSELLRGRVREILEGP